MTFKDLQQKPEWEITSNANKVKPLHMENWEV